MIVEPKIRGFICTTAHPQGCAQNVLEQIKYVQEHKKIQMPKKVLVIGSSTGYGLASRIVAAFGANAQTIGVCFEKPAEGKRTASAGWYNTAAFEQFVAEKGLYAKTINGDAFSHEIKQQTLELIRKDWQGEVDLVVYSLASPKRKDASTGQIYSSTLKPIGKAFTSKTVDVMTGRVSEITLEPAAVEEIEDTVKVMGGEDWAGWIKVLREANLLAKNAVTVAYSYIGPKLTHSIYREGTIGQAKLHLEKTAKTLNQQLADISGKAYISVNKALVTQASAAIPVVPLYVSLLYKVMKERHVHEGCIEQIWRLFADYLYSGKPILLDDDNFIRLDDCEMRDNIQALVEKLWEEVDANNLEKISDIAGYRQEFLRLFGFGLASVDYQADVNIDVKIPSLTSAT